MPKSLDEDERKRKRSSRAANLKNTNESATGTGAKKKRVQTKRAILEGIEMSKELAAKVKQKRTTGSRRSLINREPKLCGNGKPMPSLAELEAMYQDSDDEGESSKPSNPVDTTQEAILEPKLDERRLLELSDLNTVNPQETKADQNSEINGDLQTPDLLKVINLLSGILEKKDDSPPPPIIPPKKRKKPDQPYIVGCKERKQVPWAPKTKWCVGDEDYGVDPNGGSDDDDECPTKRKKRGKKVNLSKSIFNAKTDEIAARLLENETNQKQECRGSPDSNDTVEYDLSSISPSFGIPRAFSPLPSTSKDCETIMKNDKLFDESLHTERLPNDSLSDVEVIEVPCETIVIDSPTMPNTKIERTWDFEDDCCVIEPEVKSERNLDFKDNSPKDDVYGSIDLTQTYDNEIYEIGDDDIESVIAENKAILGKNNKNNTIDSVTDVDSSLIFVSETRYPESKAQQNHSNATTCVQSSSNTEVKANVTIQTKPPERPADTPRNNGIEEVVVDFFNQPQNTSVRAGTIDLTSCQERFRDRFSSFFSSIESLFWGLSNSRANLNTSNDVVLVEDNIPATPSQYTQIQTASNSSAQLANTQNVPVSSNPTVPNNTSVPPSPKKNNKTVDKPVTSASSHGQTYDGDESKSSGRRLGDCPICMDNLENGPVASTLCGHVFCMNCIKAAIRANGKKCPTCRKALKGQQGYHQIFL